MPTHRLSFESNLSDIPGKEMRPGVPDRQHAQPYSNTYGNFLAVKLLNTHEEISFYLGDVNRTILERTKLTSDPVTSITSTKNRLPLTIRSE